MIRAIAERLSSSLDNLGSCDVAALNSGMGAMLDRIFSDGMAFDSAIGRPPVAKKRLGVYSRSWGLVRVRAGADIGTKNLNISGKNLFRKIDVGTNSGKAVVGFTTDKARLIAQGQESQTRKRIFGFNDAEKRVANEEYRRCVEQVIKQAFNVSQRG